MLQPSIVVLSDPPPTWLSRPLPLHHVCLLKGYLFNWSYFNTFSQSFHRLPPVSGVASLSLSLSPSDPGWLPVSPLGSTKRFQMKSISMCVLACVFSLSLSRAQRALSLSLRRASFHSSLAQIHALGAAFKRKPVHSPSQSDMGLTRSNRFLDSVRVRDFWGLRFFLIFYFLHRSSWNESGRKKKKKKRKWLYELW